MTILEILPYCPKYSLERSVGMSYDTTFNKYNAQDIYNAYLLLREARSHAHNVGYVALYDTHIGKVAPTQGFQLLPLALALFLLLRQALVAREHEQGEHTLMKQGHSLLLVDGLELDSLVGVLPTAGRAPPVEVLLDVVPAETADLRTQCTVSSVATRVHIVAPGNRTDTA